MGNMQQTQETKGRLWAKVVAKAWADVAFKEKLISDPAAVLKAEGIEVPQGVNLKVVEDTATVRHLVLPVLPPDAGNMDEAAVGERMAANDCWLCGE